MTVKTLLETLILRDCASLEEKRVYRFLESLRIGHFRFIRHFDVSNDGGGLVYGRSRCNTPNFPLEELKEERPGLAYVAGFRSPSLSPSSSSSSSSSGDSSWGSGTDEADDDL